METVLIVDDEQDFRFNLSLILKSAGYEVRTAAYGRQVFKEIAECAPSIALLDIGLPDMDGMRVLERMRKLEPEIPVIVVTAHSDIEGAVQAMKMGAYDYIVKPFNNEELILIIKKALETRSLSLEVERLRKKLGYAQDIEEVMGKSPRVQQILKQVEIIAPTNMTVIIQGSSGTGKELIARRIHLKSLRSHQSFVAIDCGALPETLMESEFFGYEKGAFTGADGRKEGKFEQAQGGTLFLDEIANLSEAVQMKLLRVIQERRLQHLGGRREISIDVRILVASNVSLSEQVRKGRFRNDLYHRLNEFQIELPRLIDRMEDIPVLTKYFLKGANGEFQKAVKGFSAEAMRHLLSYVWPGNVRELMNVIRKAVLLAESDTIGLENLSLISPSSPSETVETGWLPVEGESFEETTRKFQKSVINKALGEAGGKITKAAEILKLNKKTLYRKLKSLNH